MSAIRCNRRIQILSGDVESIIFANMRLADGYACFSIKLGVRLMLHLSLLTPEEWINKPNINRITCVADLDVLRMLDDRQIFIIILFVKINIVIRSYRCPKNRCFGSKRPPP